MKCKCVMRRAFWGEILDWVPDECIEQDLDLTEEELERMQRKDRCHIYTPIENQTPLLYNGYDE